MTSAARDRWAEWLAERRFGGDHEIRERSLAQLTETRDRVLDRCRFVEAPADDLEPIADESAMLDFDERELLRLAEEEWRSRT